MQIMSCNKFPGFNLTAGDLNLTILVEVFTNHISAENTYFTNYLEWTEHKIMGFKPANRYRIIRQSLLFMISIIIHFFVNQKLCKHYVYGAEHNKLQRQDINHSNIYLLLDLLWFQESILEKEISLYL